MYTWPPQEFLTHIQRDLKKHKKSHSLRSKRKSFPPFCLRLFQAVPHLVTQNPKHIFPPKKYLLDLPQDPP